VVKQSLWVSVLQGLSSNAKKDKKRMNVLSLTNVSESPRSHQKRPIDGMVSDSFNAIVSVRLLVGGLSNPAQAIQIHILHGVVASLAFDVQTQERYGIANASLDHCTNKQTDICIKEFKELSSESKFHTALSLSINLIQ
jgi:hypothetical protein